MQLNAVANKKIPINPDGPVNWVNILLFTDSEFN